MARLMSVNVGLPRDIEWKGRTVHTGVWKTPVKGQCWVGKTNLAGDGQGDLQGHGGPNRAVLVYQCESYRHWKTQLGRADLAFGHFGENFTVDGLSDAEVCIGDRYQIGQALFEVTQPRVTCYRVGIRLNEPRMPALMTSTGRPGFYLRVLTEGVVGAGDEILKVGEAQPRMSVFEVNNLLYSSAHPRDQLERALQIDALSPGWRCSFEQMLQAGPNGRGQAHAGLSPSGAMYPAAPGFRSLAAVRVERVSEDVVALTLSDLHNQPLDVPKPGQFIVLRLLLPPDGRPSFRSYSLCGSPSASQYRIAVKVNSGSVVGSYLRDRLREGDTIEVSVPRGAFTLNTADHPIVFLSAGIGVTPVLAMLHDVVAARVESPVLWLHSARDGQHHPFADEARELVKALPHGRSCIAYSRPLAADRLGKGYDVAGHFSRDVLQSIGLEPNAQVYICGPGRFMDDMTSALKNLGVTSDRIHSEAFSGGESLKPGIVGDSNRKPHTPSNDADTGHLVSFARSGVSAHWDSRVYGSLLELAEACDVPVRWACRSGVCHNCETGLIEGEVHYEVEPIDLPPKGNVLVCCARPEGNVVLDA
ncbi:MOSC and FAD-binding oxidoreductase domain-containing protein [Paraburkholderia megapolitana]|uniref:nitric oxide dioxygenase n=1 Tax=Paraburkholderia megapolitana TaxID=420953 RepID=A0A1I3MLL2_9BURK|nr:MOSC and FAD-binding oxidoreductase domain-containing protein [Paraburkholderia megapolitana]QDQ84051.1 MOSC domain-containing protein [Paraburkholderia megapolitana]SFI97566.1 MOSC domain-containing protein YiiM [Paraburkholderia megapolitana]